MRRLWALPFSSFPTNAYSMISQFYTFQTKVFQHSTGIPTCEYRLLFPPHDVILFLISSNEWRHADIAGKWRQSDFSVDRKQPHVKFTK